MRMSKCSSVFLGAAFIISVGWNHSFCHAQLIGNRTVGAPIGSPTAGSPAAGSTGVRQPGTGIGNTGVGSPAQGTASVGNGISPSISGRFIRGTRQRGDFVGSNRTDQQGFVGSTQAIGVGRVQSATDNLKISKSRTTNVPLPPQPKSGMYYPKLELDESFSIAPEERESKASGLETLPTIHSRMKRVSNSDISLELKGRTAVLRGKVDSQRQFDLLASMLQLEPGIDDVRNEIVVTEKRR